MLLHKSVVSDSRVRREAAALVAAGHDVVVLELATVDEPTAGSRPPHTGSYPPHTGSHPARIESRGAQTGSRGAHTACLDGFRRRSVLPPVWMRRRMPFHLYRAAFLGWFVAGIVRERPDVVHAHDAAMLMPGVLGARLTGARLVYDSHELATSVPYRARAWALFVAAIERLAVPRCDAVITVSAGIAERLQARYRLAQGPAVLRNVSALSPGGSGGLRERLGIDGATPLVLHQGAPAPARGCEVLVGAVAQLPGVHLAFLGDPNPAYAQTLRNTIAAHGVSERIRLLPGVPLSDLLAHTAEADIGVTLLQDTCLNHRLALPNKLFEYIAAGVPVLAAALPETQRLVEDYGVGWCVAPDDAQAVASALRTALYGPRDPGLQARLARAAAELSWEREQQPLLALYEQMGAAQLGAGRLGAAQDDQPMTAQQRQTHEDAVATPGASGQRWEESHRAQAAYREVPAGPIAPAEPAGPIASAEPAASVESVAQLGDADQTRVAVGGPHTRLPDRHGAVGGEHAAHLTQRLLDDQARAHGG
jgi:glycosyltransferase involved in cell wall biosynthesis